MGNTYYYYKCGNAKRHGKAHCDLKAIRKEPLERFVVDTAIKVIFSDEIIEQLIDLVAGSPAEGENFRNFHISICSQIADAALTLIL